VEDEVRISREEARAMLFAIADINVNIERILRLLEETLEEGPEEDSLTRSPVSGNARGTSSVFSGAEPQVKRGNRPPGERSRPRAERIRPRL
jgi:hypothetical protein